MATTTEVTSTTTRAWPVLVGNVELWPGTIADFQHAQIQQYQAALQAANNHPQQVSGPGKEALGNLLTSLDRLLRYDLNKYLTQSVGSHNVPVLFDELLSNAYAECITAAAQYDPGKGAKFTTWILSQGGPVRQSFREGVAQWRGVTHVGSRRRQEIAMQAQTVIAHLTARLGRVPPVEQVQDELLNREFGRAIARLAAADDDVELTVTQWVQREKQFLKQAEQTLRKDGTLRAVEDLPELLTITQAADTLLVDTFDVDLGFLFTHDTPDPDPDDNVLLSVASCGLTDSEQTVLRAQYGDDGGLPMEVGQGLAQRVFAPHVQYAALALTLPLQFEQSPTQGQRQQQAAADSER